MREPAVLVIGAGPSGLMLAGELALAGIDVLVLERRSDQVLMGARAGGLHARTLELLELRGIADRFVAAGTMHPAVGFAGVSLGMHDCPTRFPGVLALWQVHIERLLAEWLRELQVPIRYGAELVDLVQDDDAAVVTLRDGERLRVPYVVGCDGGRSTVRRLARIEFPGTAPTTSNLIAEARYTEEPTTLGIHRDAQGIHSLAKSEDGAQLRVLVTEPRADATSAPTLEELRAVLRAVYGSDFGIHDPTWLSRFTDATRQAARYRDRRILLAGDAAHIHPPDGGHGLQTGVHDAVNLGWKLAQVLQHRSPDSLLDTYHAERHPVAAWVLKNTMASVLLRRADAQTQALRETMADMLGTDAARRRLAAQMAGLDIRYDLGEGHPVRGRRMPDLDLETAEGPRRVAELLRPAKPVLLDFAGACAPIAAAWSPRLRVCRASCDSEWVLPAVGPVTAPTAVLIRPDGYVAWAGEDHELGVRSALERWCGMARTGP